MKQLPIVGSKGVFTFLTPLEYLENMTKVYECIAVRSFGDIVNDGRDPKEYYTRLNLPEGDYEKHAREGGYIVSLKADSDQTYQVPLPYIKSWPITGGVAYEVLALVVNLGAISKTKEMGFLLTKVNNLIRDNIGINGDARLVKISETEYKTSEEAEALENTRDTLIKETLTDTAKATQLQEALLASQAENQALRKYISDKGL